MACAKRQSSWGNLDLQAKEGKSAGNLPTIASLQCPSDNFVWHIWPDGGLNDL